MDPLPDWTTSTASAYMTDSIKGRGRLAIITGISREKQPSGHIRKELGALSGRALACREGLLATSTLDIQRILIGRFKGPPWDLMTTGETKELTALGPLLHVGA